MAVTSLRCVHKSCIQLVRTLLRTYTTVEKSFTSEKESSNITRNKISYPSKPGPMKRIRSFQLVSGEYFTKKKYASLGTRLYHPIWKLRRAECSKTLSYQRNIGNQRSEAWSFVPFHTTLPPNKGKCFVTLLRLEVIMNNNLTHFVHFSQYLEHFEI